MNRHRPSFDVRAELAELDAYILGIPDHLASLGYLAPYESRATFLRDELALCEAREHSDRLCQPIQVMRLRRRWADKYAVPLDFLGNYCRYWAALAASALAVIRASDATVVAMAADSFLALPASPASYSLGMAISHPSAAEIHRIMARGLRHGLRIDHLRAEFGEKTTIDRTAYRGIFGLIADAGIDVEFSYLPRESELFQDSVQVSASDAARTCELLATVTESEREVVVDGSLVGASLNRGRLEVRNPAGRIVSAAVPDTNLLRGLRLGTRYRVTLAETRTTDGVSGKKTTRESVLSIVQATPERDESTQSDVSLTVSPFPSDKVPEGNSLKRIYTMIQILNSGESLTATGIGVTTDRWLQYYRHSARVLGFLDADGSLSRLGGRVAAMSYERFLAQTCIQFEVSDVGIAWMEWAGVSTMLDLRADQAKSFVEQRVEGLSGTNIDRRAGTLRSWLKKLRPHHFANEVRDREEDG